MKLTDLSVKALPLPEKGQRTYWDKGFGVRVSQGGSKTFVMKHEGRWITLGKYPLTSLKLAREAYLRVKLDGTPTKRLESLSDARTAYLAECEAKLRPSTFNQYRSYLSQVDKPTLSDVLRSDIDLSSPHTVMTWKVFFNWCIRNELTDKNPFAHQAVKWNSRSRVLTDDEIAKLWAYDYPPYSDYIKLLILTGQRVGQFKSFVLHDDTVLFPAGVMKNRQDHELPLTDTARPYFERLIPFNGWSKAKARIDKETGVSNWVQHDLRRTLSTTMASLQVPLHVTEAILAHSSGTVSGVAATYNRYNYLIEMRSAIEIYEKHIQSLTA